MVRVSFSKDEEIGIITTFLNRVSKQKSLESLSLEEIDEIKKDVKLFKENPPSYVYHYRVELIKIVHFLNQYVISNRYRPDQEIAFFILALDPTFKMIRCYNECNGDTGQYKTQMIQKFGIFNIDLLKLESKFYIKYRELLQAQVVQEQAVSKEEPLNGPNTESEIDNTPPKL